MSVQPPPKGWNVLGATFMGCGGVLLTVLGGVCSYGVGAEVLRDGGVSGLGMLLVISLAVLGGGIALIYRAIKLLRE